MKAKTRAKKIKPTKNPGVMGMMNQGIPFVKMKPTIDTDMSTEIKSTGGKRNMHGIGY